MLILYALTLSETNGKLWTALVNWIIQLLRNDACSIIYWGIEITDLLVMRWLHHLDYRSKLAVLCQCNLNGNLLPTIKSLSVSVYMST